MTTVPMKGFVVYNSVDIDIRIKAYVNNKANAVEFTTISQTYSKAITFNPNSAEEEIIFELTDVKKNKYLGIALTLNEYTFNQFSQAYILELKKVGNSYTIEEKYAGNSIINFYNSAGAISKFEIYELPANKKLDSKNLGKPIWTSSSKALTQSESIDLDTLQIKDMTLLAVKANVTLGLNALSTVPVLYSKGNGRVASYKLTGTLFTTKLEPNN